MSELMNMRHSQADFRWHLLASASAAALTAFACMGDAFADNDSDHPTVWIELGGQLNDLSNSQESFAPPFVAGLSQYGIKSPLLVEKPPRYGLDTEGAISFEPNGSNWILSASVRYGRSNATRKQHQQTPNAIIPIHFQIYSKYQNKYYYPSSHVKFADASANQSAQHLIVDFQAGKDLGLGMFGRRGSSVLSAGLRIAQFSSKSNVTMHLEPDVHYTPSKAITSFPAFVAFNNYAAFHFHDDKALATSQRDFHGAGPSLAWSASMPLAGNLDTGELAVDWGANAAVLFGRQKVKAHHQTTVRSYYRKGWGGVAAGIHGFGGGEYNHSTQQTSHAANPSRERSVTVPNLGGFAGLSLRYTNAKISFGYKADFFFNAIDGGIDTRKSEDVGFHGPFATISIGLGG